MATKRGTATTPPTVRPLRPATPVRETPKDSTANIIPRSAGLSPPRTVATIGGTRPTGPAVSGVSGKVVDEKGEALPGATVRFFSPTGAVLDGKITDDYGNFRLSVPPGTQYMLVSYIGFGERKIDPLPIQPILVKMSMGNALDEFTVTAKAYKWFNRYGLYLILGGVVLMILGAAFFASKRRK